jgi:hypothetical protein
VLAKMLVSFHSRDTMSNGGIGSGLAGQLFGELGSDTISTTEAPEPITNVRVTEFSGMNKENFEKS